MIFEFDMISLLFVLFSMWVSGIFTGIGIRQKLLEPQISNKQPTASNECTQNPLPMSQIESD